MSIRRLSSGPSAVLKTAVMTLLLFGASAAGAQPPEVKAEHASQAAKAPGSEAAKAPEAAANQGSFHDLICKPNGSEDSFDCADEATPAKIVPIPSQVSGPRFQDMPVKG